MRSFFVQLFLSFWIGTIGIFIGATLFFPNQDPGSPDNLRSAVADSAQAITELTIKDYRANGCSAVNKPKAKFEFADESGDLLCSTASEKGLQGVLQQAMESGSAAGRHIGSTWIQVYPVSLLSGEKWFLIQKTSSRPRPWWPRLPKSALPVSILVTFLFAYILTRPVRKLSNAFRRFTAGDLATRLPVSSRAHWGGLGGADVRTLMLDFNSMADRVTELIEAHKMLVRDISHELRSPLARLRVALELAREEVGSPLPEFDRMEREAERVNDLIGEMLTLSLLESTRKILGSDTFTMNELLDELLPDAEFEASARDCTICVTIESDKELWLNGQKELLRRALENILRNAIRYTPAGGTINIDLHSIPLAEGVASSDTQQPISLVLSFRDRGPGIPEANLPHIFRPFYRVDTARAGSTGGFGIGLAIAERAVHVHGGQIVVSNREGGGLSVELILPLAHAFTSPHS